MATKKQVVITEWKTIGTQESFTVLGLGDDQQVYFWKDKKWNLL
jgi:hypothetical protein